MRTSGTIPLALPITLFLLGGVLGLWASYDWRLSAAWLFWLGVGGWLYVLIVWIARRPHWLPRISSALVAFGAVYALYVITQYRWLGFEPKYAAITVLGQFLSAPFPPLLTVYVDDNAAGGVLGVLLLLSFVDQRPRTKDQSDDLRTTDHRPSTIDHRPPTADHRPPTADHRPPTTDHRPPTADRGHLLSCSSCNAVLELSRVVLVALIGVALLLTAARGAWLGAALALVLGVLGPQIVQKWQQPASASQAIDPQTAPIAPHAGRLVSDPATKQRRRVWLLGVCVGVVVLSAVLVGAVLRAQGAAGIEVRADSRITLYRNAFHLALSFPFTGIGPGGVFGLVYSRFQLGIPVEFVGYAHNLPLSIWLGQGLLGLVGFCALLLGSFRAIWSQLQDPSTPYYRLRWSAALGLVVALIHGLTDAPQYDTAWPLMLLLWVLLGLAVGEAAEQRGGGAAVQRLRGSVVPAKHPQVGRLVALAAILFIAIVSAPTIAALGATNVAAVYHSRALLAPNRSDAQRAALLQSAADWANTALRSAPSNGLAAARAGALALERNDFPNAVRWLSTGAQALPMDQGIRKNLGYALIWNGQPAHGAQVLRTLDRAAEVRSELQTWQIAWRERGRDELGARAAVALENMRP